jgi:hypothetical protein
MASQTVLYEFTHQDGSRVLVEGTTQGRALQRLCAGLYTGRVPTPLEAAKLIASGSSFIFMPPDSEADESAALPAEQKTIGYELDGHIIAPPNEPAASLEKMGILIDKDSQNYGGTE